MPMLFRFSILLISLALIGCPIESVDPKTSNSFSPLPYYDANSDTVAIFGIYPVPGVIQIAESSNEMWAAYTKVDTLGGNIDLFMMSHSDGIELKLTSDANIEFDPAVSNAGSIAYAVHEHSVSSSYIVRDNTKLDYDAGVHKNLIFIDETLYSSYNALSEDKSYLYVHDGLQTSRITSPIVIDVLHLTPNGRLLSEGVRKDSGVRSVYSYDSGSREFTPECTQEPCSYQDESVITWQEANTSSAILSLAIDFLLIGDPLFNQALGNNFLGRISWGVSYRIHGLLDLIENGEDLAFNFASGIGAHELVQLGVHKLVQSASTDRLLPGWPTKKYSISREVQLSLMVDNAAILYPILRACRLGIAKSEDCDKAVSLTSELFEFYESQFSLDTGTHGGYKIRYGIDFHYDGVWMPFNWQNLFGLALLEAYEITGRQDYIYRTLQLARTFESELRSQSDGRLFWSYWPQKFYLGWQESDGISSNTPSHEPTTDERFEDLAHSAINVQFINQIYKRTSAPDAQLPEVFTADQIAALSKTLEGARYAHRWSRFMSGDVAYQNPSMQFSPDWGWLRIADRPAAEQLIMGAPSYYPFFEGSSFAQHILIYLLSREDRG